MTKLRLILTAATIAATVSACSSSPTAPTPPPIPQVAGSYNGNVTVTFPEIPATRTCPANTSVTQSGNTVSIAPIVLGGSCGNISLPLGQSTIDATGALSSSSGTLFEPSCGGNYTYTASGGFFGRELRISMNATSPVCFNFNFTAVLSR